MGDTDSHDHNDFPARRDAAGGRGLTAPRRRFPGSPPTQRDRVDTPRPDLDDSPVPPVPPVPPAPLRPVRSPNPIRSPRPSQPATDRGFFDPTTITWQLHSDPLMGLAGLRALLLHALHPLTMAAVDAHSTHDWDLWLRLSRTTGYVGVTTYGSAAEAMLAGSRLQAVHARVYGVSEQGRPYAAQDPSLLAWVHTCLVASFLEIITRGGLALAPQQQDSYVAEQVRSAALVGLEPDEVPHDRRSLVAHFRRLRPALTVTPQAQAAAVAVVYGDPPLRSPGVPAPERPPWAGVAGLAFATLPPWARRLYALPELPGAAGLSEAAATVALRELRTSLKNTQSGPTEPANLPRPGPSPAESAPAPRATWSHRQQEPRAHRE
jgi:uncharacterized protein (DUF2236 family)